MKLTERWLENEFHCSTRCKCQKCKIDSILVWMCPNSKNNIASCFLNIALKFEDLRLCCAQIKFLARRTHTSLNNYIYRLYSPDCHFASSRSDAHNCHHKYHQGSPQCIKCWALHTHVFTHWARRLNWVRVVCGIRARPGTYALVREKLTGPVCLEVHNSIIESSPEVFRENGNKRIPLKMNAA